MSINHKRIHSTCTDIYQIEKKYPRLVVIIIVWNKSHFDKTIKYFSHSPFEIDFNTY